MSNTKTLNEQIEAKRAEVTKYERILGGYYGRWYDMGRRHLESLRAELAALENQEAVASAASTGV